MSVLCTCTAFCGRQIMPEQALKDTLVTQKRTEMTIQKIKSSLIAFVFVFAAVGCEDPSGQNSTGGGVAPQMSGDRPEPGQKSILIQMR